MGLVDKLKAGAEQAAAKVKEEARELQLKREIGQEEGALGRKALALVEGGQLSHPDLDEHVQRIHELRDKLNALAGGEAEEGEPAETAGPSAPPAMPS